MPHYLFEVAYTAESWKTQVEQQGNVVERVDPLLDALGARLDCVYYAFGDRDLVAIAEFPDNESAAAFSLAVAAGGSARVTTTPLLAVDQGISAMQKAATVGSSYIPPVPT